MSNKEIKDRLSDGEGAPDERTDMEEQIDAVMDRLTDPPDDEEDLDDLGEYDDSKEEYEDTEPDEEMSTDEEAAEDDEESTDDAESYDEAGEVYEERPHPARHKSARPGPVVYVPLDDMDEQPVQKKKRHKKKHKGGRIFGLLLLMVLVVGGCAYAGASYYFSDRFFEGTWINGVNCSQMTAYEVENLFKQKFQDYSIEVSSRGLDPQTIAGDQIDYQYLSTGEVLKLLQQQKPYEWIKGMYEQKSYTVSENTGYNKTKLQEQLKSLNCAQAENQTAPENAYVAFQDGQFVIVPETEGSKLDLKEAYNALSEAVPDRQVLILRIHRKHMSALMLHRMIRHCSLLWKHAITIREQVLPILLVTVQKRSMAIPSKTGCSLTRRDSLYGMIILSSSMWLITWHSLQQLMIQSVQRENFRQQAAEPFMYPVPYTDGRSTRVRRQHS